MHFTDICSHNGPPGETDYYCTPYGGLTPAASSFPQMLDALRARNARYVGVNTSYYACRGVDASTTGPGTPCRFMDAVAQGTRSVDLDGDATIHDMSNGGLSDEAFVDTIAGALETIATRVPFDVDAFARDDTSDSEGVDATRFIAARTPACIADPATDPCWVAPSGVLHPDAVRAMDETAFRGLVPGTRVTFRMTFRNDFFEPDQSVHVFVAYVDVRADGITVLDTRQVFVVVPASPGGPLI